MNDKNWNKLKQIVTDCIIYEQEEKDKMQELQLIHLREKAHYKMKSYQWILHEIVRLEEAK